MAIPLPQHHPQHLRALVDMGSNGIRFSISSLAPPTARILPTLFQSRAGISLYDAQHSASGQKQPIPTATIEAVIASLQQFRRTCEDFGLGDGDVTVLATEATRTAENSEAFRQRIADDVGWEVRMLAKEDEGRVGALGVGSSLPEVSGLVMDLGGGSTQLSWLVKRAGCAEVEMPERGAVSLPYGAAALSLRLAEAEKGGRVRELEKEVREKVVEAYSRLEVPAELQQRAQQDGGFTLYLSGGGFRGWGYILMSQHRVRLYPIPSINGFKVSRQDFLSTDTVAQAAAATLESDQGDDDIFRISERRAGQVPAVAFLIKALAQALPQVKEVRFCQGGVREGYLFSTLPPAIAAQHPLTVATQPFSTPSSSKQISELLASALPAHTSAGAPDDYKSKFTPDLLSALANLMYYHSTHSKDLQTTSALRSTTSGVLAGTHGILHESRALLALLLCSRHGGEVPPSDVAFKQSLEQLVESPWTLWWTNYLGAVAALVGCVYPAGVIEGRGGRLQFAAEWESDGKGRAALVLRIGFGAGLGSEVVTKELKGITKVGKRKRWIGGKMGAGYKVELDVSFER